MIKYTIRDREILVQWLFAVHSRMRTEFHPDKAMYVAKLIMQIVSNSEGKI